MQAQAASVPFGLSVKLLAAVDADRQAIGALPCEFVRASRMTGDSLGDPGNLQAQWAITGSPSDGTRGAFGIRSADRTAPTTKNPEPHAKVAV